MTQQFDLNPREQFLTKFDDPATTLEEVLQWESIVDEYIQGEQKVHQFINKHIDRLIQLMTIEGPEHDHLRSLLFPRVSADLLSSGHPTMNLLLLTPTTSYLNSEPLCNVLDYFQGTPNNILSGYVVKVLTCLYQHQPVKTQDYIFRRKYAIEMVKFLSSRSVSDFLVSLVAIQDDRILTYYLKQRNDFLNYLADVYAQGALGQDQLAHLGITLYQILNRIWSQKFNQSAQFVTTVFRISQLILDNANNLIQHNSDLLPLVVQKLALKGKQSPFLLKQSANRIIYALSTYQPEIWTSPQGKSVSRFSKQNLKLLIALSTIIINNYGLVAEILKNSGCFAMLLDLMVKYQLNNMVHVEVQKIFKAALQSENSLAYPAIIQNGQFLVKVNEMVFNVQNNPRTSKGYLGCMINILVALQNSIKTSKIFSQLSKTHPDFVNILSQYLKDKISKKQINLAGCRLQSDYSVPQYDENVLQQKYKDFFSSQKIQKDPRFAQNKQTLNEIFNQSQLNKQWCQQPDQIRSY